MLSAECLFHIHLSQSRQKAGFIPKYRRRVMIRMPSFPVGKYYNSRPPLPEHARDLQSVLPRVFHSPIGDIESLPPRDAEYFRRIRGFAGTILGAASCSHFPLGEIEDSRAIAPLRHFEQRAPAGLLDVVAVGREGQNVERRSRHVSRDFPAPARH